MEKQEFCMEKSQIFQEMISRISKLSQDSYLMVTDMQHNLTFVPESTAEFLGIPSSGSPTSTSRQPGRSAASSARISARSTIEVLSTITASASKGSFSFLRPSPPFCCSAHAQQVVDGSAPPRRSSPTRWSASSVAAQSSTSSPMRSKSATMPRTLVVLPVPGPPVRISSSSCAASSTACRCNGAYSMQRCR